MATIALDARKWHDYGIGTYVRCLSEELAALGSEHRFVLFVHPEVLPTLHRSSPRLEGIAVASKSYSLAELVSVSHALRRTDADLFHAVHYTLPLWLPCPAVVTVHDLIHLRFPQFLPGGARRGPARLYANVMLRTSTRRARRVLTPSHHTAHDLERLLGVDPAKLRVVHNGVDPRFFEPLPSATRRQHVDALGVRGPFILFVGNPKPHKNVGRLIDAFARLALENQVSQELTLVLAGADSPDRDELYARPTSQQLGSRLIILSKVSEGELHALYAEARMFVYPSLYEGFGLPVVEAMAAGTPVVSSHGSALTEVCGEAALLVDPLSTDELAAAIARLDADATLREDLARRGKERAARFSWRSAAQATLEVYEQVLEEAR